MSDHILVAVGIGSCLFIGLGEVFEWLARRRSSSKGAGKEGP